MQYSLAKIVRSFLWHTGLGRRTAAWFWRNKADGPGFEVLLAREEAVFEDIPTDFTSGGYGEFVARDSARWSRQPEYVVAVCDVLLEPERLLGTRAGRELVEQTIVYKFDRQYPYVLPYLLHRHRPTQTLEEAIYYDGSATRNYYHHFVNALSMLEVWERAKLPRHLPLLITRAMFEQVYFQYLYKRSSQFRQLPWRVVEPHEWLLVKKLYLTQAIHFAPATWQAMRRLYELPDRRPRRRIFLNRDRRRYGRYLTNEDEVVAMLTGLGFENTFAEHLNIEQQAQMFQETEYLVALTGAGLIQQFFMNPSYGSVIEIMPSSRLMPEYYWQAYTLRMHYYDVVVGGPMHDGKDYHVDLAELETAVQRMLANQHTGPTYGRTMLPASHGTPA
jgi:hypothetical protein